MFSIPISRLFLLCGFACLFSPSQTVQKQGASKALAPRGLLLLLSSLCLPSSSLFSAVSALSFLSSCASDYATEPRENMSFVFSAAGTLRIPVDLQHRRSLRSQLVKWDPGDPSCYLLNHSVRSFPPFSLQLKFSSSPQRSILSPPSFDFLSDHHLSDFILLLQHSLSSPLLKMKIQRSIHSLTDGSFSPRCPAVLSHCHPAANERSPSHGWYSCCYCAFVANVNVCRFWRLL